jgi:hypothetical protein
MVAVALVALALAIGVGLSRRWEQFKRNAEFHAKAAMDLKMGANSAYALQALQHARAGLAKSESDLPRARQLWAEASELGDKVYMLRNESERHLSLQRFYDSRW